MIYNDIGLAMKFDGFDWDSGNKEKCQKHGVSLIEIESLFYKRLSVFPDVKYSSNEQRFIAVGITFKSRYLFIIFTIRKNTEKSFIRPISARYMHKKEIAAYEKEISKF